MQPNELTPLVEALLFAAQEPMSTNTLAKAIGDGDVSAADVKAVLDSLGTAYDAEGRGFKLVRLGTGYQVVTRARYEPWVRSLLAGKQKSRLSRAALETVAVIAYKQPITRLDIEGIRGVDVGGVLNTLLERGLIMIKGRDPGPGRPLLYGTTAGFLDYFGIPRLNDLPKMDEIAALAASEAEGWDETERARFEKFGVDPEAIPPADAGAADAETRDEDRERFQEVATGFAAGAAGETEAEPAPGSAESGGEPDRPATAPGTPGPGY
jgi:segregation and condensation protein B